MEDPLTTAVVSLVPLRFVPLRPLTRAQFRVVAIMFHQNLVDYAGIAEEIGCAPRTVRAHIEQVAMWLPGDGNPLMRVALHAERLVECGFAGDDDQGEPLDAGV